LLILWDGDDANHYAVLLISGVGCNNYNWGLARASPLLNQVQLIAREDRSAFDDGNARIFSKKAAKRGGY
jgi:hypothetical protein